MSRPTAPLSGRSIIVVEDEYLIATELKRWLQEAGVEVLGPVPSVEQALDLIEDHRLDAAVLDINLGDGNTTYPVADRVDVLRVRYLFATGEVHRARPGGYTNPPLLEKPYSKSDLLHVLSGLIAA